MEGFLGAALDTIASLARIAFGHKPRGSPSAQDAVSTQRDPPTLRRPRVYPTSSSLGCRTTVLARWHAPRPTPEWLLPRAPGSIRRGPPHQSRWLTRAPGRQLRMRPTASLSAATPEEDIGTPNSICFSP